MTHCQKRLKNACKTLAILLISTLPMLAQHPNAVEQNLKKAGINRTELEKAITYCQKAKDPLKLKAIYFLIANMDIHTTANYYWENKGGQKIAYNELDYPDFDQAAKAFETIKEQNPGIEPKPITYTDLETIKGDYLIQNIDQAFAAWQNSVLKNVSFENFCEYILPYRVSVEPLQEWHTTYSQKFNWITDKIQEVGFAQTLPYIKDEANTWFKNSWGSGGRKEPLPRLGSMQLLLRKQGPCEDLADLGVFTMRSLGIPATVNSIPYWATATGGHLTNTFMDAQTAFPFDYGEKNAVGPLKREPAKVLRITYSKQATTLAAKVSSDLIPESFLRQQNYIDVTPDYWATTTVKCALRKPIVPQKIAYTAVFNGLKWRTYWWGDVINNQVEFKNLCKKTIVLPQYYIDGKMIPAAAPLLIGENENKVLTPNYSQLQDITITSFGSYLLIKPNETYKLYYWDNQWKLVSAQKATPTTTSFIYEKVPKNALLLLVASDSKGYERPFVVDEKGERTWY
ncbi:hypothetical protein [Flavobacterium faecale]|uniref:hypothetical protein n=1 Tax=Flavobacterium faecale TaxID=1355330 RepID=UPI003AAF9A78